MIQPLHVLYGLTYPSRYCFDMGHVFSKRQLLGHMYAYQGQH